MREGSEKICLAANLAKFRKKRGLTQDEVAQELFVSGKTVSKWERGLGFPEVPQLLNLASFFGVSVDRLLREERCGIAVAGSMLTDQVKRVNCYPERLMLSNILSVSRAVGGCALNTAIDLARMDRSVPVSVLGRVGRDEGGEFILNELQKNRIDCSGIRVSHNVPTSFSDVMYVEQSGERTFFHYRGANADFSPDDVDIPSLDCKMLHIGYILLLDRFDSDDAEYGTVMARFLSDVQKAGIRTSIDVVSDNAGLFAEKVMPALRYTDNAIMNEIEGCGAAGIDPRDEAGNLLPDRVRAAMEILLAGGVRERVIIHCPEAGFCLNRNGELTVVPSLLLPEGFIKGSVGAGDAFCAGCLYGIYHDYTDRAILELASGAAACNLSAEDSVSGMRSLEEIRRLMEQYPRRTPETAEDKEKTT